MPTFEVKPLNPTHTTLHCSTNVLHFPVLEMTTIYAPFSTVPQSPGLTPKQMLEVVKVLWPSLDETDFNIAEYSVFFEYVEAEIWLLHRSTNLTTGLLETTTRIFPCLQAHGAKTRDDIIQII
jgi:hypothetical protein